MLQKPNILLIGGGNMGCALLSGWEKKNSFASLAIVEPQPNDALKKYTVYPDGFAIENENFDVVIIAVKPQIVLQVLTSLKRFAKPDTLFISIAAGKKIETMQELIGDKTAFIRAMPNMPAMIGQGITVCVANKTATKPDRDLAQNLLGAVGDVVWIDDEEQMHAVTALSGSGPAYVFALIEAMQHAGEGLGLSPDLAARLARQTVQGSAAMAATQIDKTPQELRHSVTSPKGTTEAALDILLAENGLDRLMADAMRAAVQRSKDLG